VTVRQLLGARPDASDGTLKARVDGKECQLVTLVARLVASDAVETGLSLTLDDGSGLLNAKVYGSGDAMRGIAVGSYVRVYGNIDFHGVISIHVTHIQAVEDTQELTDHFLDCVGVHLCNTKAASIFAAASTSTFRAGGMPGGAAGRSDAPLEDQVLGLIRRCRDPRGCSINSIARALGLALESVRAATDSLIENMQICCTVDMYHFCCAD
jgi:replication factor A2